MRHVIVIPSITSEPYESLEERTARVPLRSLTAGSFTAKINNKDFKTLKGCGFCIKNLLALDLNTLTKG